MKAKTGTVSETELPRYVPVNVARQLTDLRDLKILNDEADALNDEALDNLAFVSAVFQACDEEQP